MFIIFLERFEVFFVSIIFKHMVIILIYLLQKNVRDLLNVNIATARKFYRLLKTNTDKQRQFGQFC